MSELILIVGGMRSGKTRELTNFIDTAFWTESKYKVFYPAINSRDEEHFICSRRGVKEKAIKTYTSSEIIHHVSEEDKFIFIDEFQFYDDNITTIVRELLAMNKIVYCAGLDLDFAERPWANTVELYPLADKVIKLNSVCEICKEPRGRRTLRLINNSPADHNTPLILIEGLDSHIEHKTVCADCYRFSYLEKHDLSQRNNVNKTYKSVCENTLLSTNHTVSSC